MKGIPAIEVEENEMGTGDMAAFHVKVPPHGVFQVNIHGDTEGTYIISPHPQLENKNPNIFQHEKAIVTNDEVDPFRLVAVTCWIIPKHCTFGREKSSDLQNLKQFL